MAIFNRITPPEAAEQICPQCAATVQVQVVDHMAAIDVVFCSQCNRRFSLSRDAG